MDVFIKLFLHFDLFSVDFQVKYTFLDYLGVLALVVLALQLKVHLKQKCHVRIIRMVAVV